MSSQQSPRNLSFRHLLSIAAGALVLLVGAASPAIAEDVLLDSSNVNLPSANVTLIRTKMTPKEVKLHLPISMGRNVCVRTGIIIRSGQSGFHCGYNKHVERVCQPERTCRTDRQGKQICVTGRRCFDRVVDVARYCSWEETVCTATKLQHSTETRSVTLKFKRMPKLSGNEIETFRLIGRQNHVDGSDAKFSLTALETQGPVSIDDKDGVFTGFKDVIVIKGR